MAVEAPTPAKFLSTFPEITVSSDAVVNAAGELALRISNVSQDAVLYLTAHLLSIQSEDTGAPDGGAGEVVSERTGPMDTKYLVQAETNREVFFTRTSYGRMFLILERRAPARPFRGVMIYR